MDWIYSANSYKQIKNNYFFFFTNSFSLWATNFDHQIPKASHIQSDKAETTHINNIFKNSGAISICISAPSTVNVIIIYLATQESTIADLGSAIFSMFFTKLETVSAILNQISVISNATASFGINQITESKKCAM